MGKCRYCGNDAGFFNNEHSKCKQKFKEGLDRIPRYIEEYFSSSLPLTYKNVSDIRESIERIAKNAFLGEIELRRCVVDGWERSITNSVESEVFPERTELMLVQFAKEFELSKTHRDCRSAWRKLQKRIEREAPVRKKKQEEQEAIIDAIKAGKPIKVDWPQDMAPFNLQKSETLVWIFKNTVYREEVLDKRAHSRYGIRHSAEYKMRYKGPGTMGLTTKHIYFVGVFEVFRIRYDRIGTFSPCQGGVRIERYAKSARPQEFITGEFWFTYSLAKTLAQLA